MFLTYAQLLLVLVVSQTKLRPGMAGAINQYFQPIWDSILSLNPSLNAYKCRRAYRAEMKACNISM